ISSLEGVERIRLSYLQPAEIRPSLLQAVISTEKVAPYFDISFQHASGTLLRRMRRFGDGEKFLHLLTQIRALSPEAGIRSNFIVGFPGESEEEFSELLDFISESRLDAIGVFPYSDEEGTEALNLSGKVSQDLIEERFQEASRVAEATVNARSLERIGEEMSVLIEEIDGDVVEGRAAHQGPEVDGSTRITRLTTDELKVIKVGQYIKAKVIETDGVDLIAETSA
ncbi:MAG: 30S ribosomal protein S12 methylthiotransferase RimO, partial [Actinobacteria bacterium]|nr:30S ribosomal protein S12 methylthiotransferase RimO [Actinomycetota bacterium]